jgi:predicted GIY-YIG superfamily endonuclease
MATQLLLFADPRPLVERLGADFFRQAPETAGVYLMRDATEAVLYVGKAKNLRKRLAHYRVANPDRMKRRHLRLLHQVSQIELEQLANETAALARESELLQSLRPRFNRAGTWSGPLSSLAWRLKDGALELTLALAAAEAVAGWHRSAPMPGALRLRASLARLCWCAIHPERSAVELPAGWFEGRQGEVVTILARPAVLPGELTALLEDLFRGQVEAWLEWITRRTAQQQHPVETAIREEDFETIRSVLKARRKPPDVGGY